MWHGGYPSLGSFQKNKKNQRKYSQMSLGWDDTGVAA
jgi:hypothetical protein